LRIGHAQDEHVLGQPTLVAAHGRSDTQRKALLAQQSVAAVTGTVGPDFAGCWVVNDVLDSGVARPRGGVLLTFLERRAHGVHARHEFAIGAQHVDHALAHAGHQLHVDGHVSAVREFHADVGDVGTQRAHRERDHVHGTALHATLEQSAFASLQLGAHFSRLTPVVGGAGVFLAVRADEGAVFHAGHVRRVGDGQVRVGALGGVQALHGAGRPPCWLHSCVVFGLASHRTSAQQRACTVPPCRPPRRPTWRS
jgi:hypothetical protein